MAPAVVLRAAVAMTGRFPALAGVDLSVDEGESVVLTGPNGAGKTSLLRVCAGLLRVTAGQAVVLGHDLTDDATAARHDVALLGHTAALYDDLTVAENVQFAVRAAGGDPMHVEGALDRLDLVGRLPRTQVARLSAGQRKRVALAVVVARCPKLWLLDEPHAGLDARSRQELAGIVAEALSGGATVISASHEVEASMQIAGRALQMAGGRVVADVRVEGNHPASRDHVDEHHVDEHHVDERGPDEQRADEQGAHEQGAREQGDTAVVPIREPTGAVHVA